MEQPQITLDRPTLRNTPTRFYSFADSIHQLSQRLPFRRAATSTSAKNIAPPRRLLSPLLSQHEYPIDLEDGRDGSDHYGIASLKRVFIGSILRESVERGEEAEGDGEDEELESRRKWLKYRRARSSTVGSRVAGHDLLDWGQGSFEIGADVRERAGDHQYTTPAYRTGILSLEVPGSENLHRKGFKKDEIVKEDRMLIKVEWTSREDLPDDGYFEGSARKFQTAESTWVEYDVKLKRDSLELYSVDVDPISAFFGKKAKRLYCIPLTSRRSALSLYSSTDLTFCITTRLGKNQSEERGMRMRKRDQVRLREGGTNIFIFKPSRSSTTKEWIWKLFLTFGGSLPAVVSIIVPALGSARVRLPLPDSIEAQQALTAKCIISACADQLSNIKEWSGLIERVSSGYSLRLAWRRGEVLDWVEGDLDWMVGYALTQPGLDCQLELRMSFHYPTTVRFFATSTTASLHLSEPPAIEGYVRRIRKNGAIERIYISTHGQLMFRTRSSRAFTPPPPVASEAGVDNPAITSMSPFVFEEDTPRRAQSLWERTFCVCGFQTPKSGEIEGQSTNYELPLAKLSREEEQRAFNQIAYADGHLEITDIECVTLIGISFEIKMSQGKVMRFECESTSMALEWAGRLGGLMKYWKRRDRLDLQHQMDLARLIPSSSFDVDATFAPLLALGHNRCVTEHCRQILRVGCLFTKQGLRGRFFRRQFILIRGRLIECEFHPRDVRNQLLLTGYHKRINRIRLDNAYIMCGQLCQAYFRRENDTAKDRGVIHRIYADDLESSDELIDCVFAIWRKGKVVRIFRARSMIERNEWLFAIKAAIESA